MTAFDFEHIELDKLITHHIGNKLRDENIILSNEATAINEDETLQYLLKYFLSQFKPVDFFNFTHSVKLEMNEVYTLAKKIFAENDEFISESQNIAKLLYESSDHPQIKEGELNVVFFSNIRLADEVVDAIGIFKSETNVPFIKIQENEKNYSIEHEFGFDLKGIDKASIIFNTDKADGYSVLVVDNANRSAEAQYWVNDFLQLKPSNDDYNNTKDFLSITKEFVTKKLAEEFELSKTDKIDLLNRSIDYFKENESFDKEEFEKNVFQDEDVISSFQDFDTTFRIENAVELDDRFEISNQAVKKQSRIFKSVLKLDKNFHVYIHGDKDLIEKGTDSDGRKFYKIYYENEA